MYIIIHASICIYILVIKNTKEGLFQVLEITFIINKDINGRHSCI